MQRARGRDRTSGDAGAPAAEPTRRGRRSWPCPALIEGESSLLSSLPACLPPRSPGKTPLPLLLRLGRARSVFHDISQSLALLGVPHGGVSPGVASRPLAENTRLADSPLMRALAFGFLLVWNKRRRETETTRDSSCLLPLGCCATLLFSLSFLVWRSFTVAGWNYSRENCFRD